MAANEKKISELPAVASVSTTDAIPIEGAGVTSKATAPKLAAGSVSANGLLVRKSATEMEARSIVAGDGVSIADGDGVSGNPTITAEVTQAELDTKVAGTGVTNIEVIRKSSTETVNNSTTLQDDDALTIAVAANETIYFDMFIGFLSSAVAAFKFAIAGPAGVAGKWSYRTDDAAWDSTLMPWNTVGGGGQAIAGAGVEKAIFLRGVARNGATPGNVRLQWAQNSAEVSNTQVLADSFVMVWR